MESDDESDSDELFHSLTVLSSGEADGVAWEFRAGDQNGDYWYGLQTAIGGSCLPVRLPDPTAHDRARRYFGTNDAGRWENLAFAGQPYRGVRYASGAIAPSVAAVRVTLEEPGEHLDAQVFPYDESAGFFVAVYAPLLRGVWAVALDSAAEELARSPLFRL